MLVLKATVVCLSLMVSSRMFLQVAQASKIEYSLQYKIQEQNVERLSMTLVRLSMTFTANGKRQTAKLKLFLSVISCV